MLGNVGGVLALREGEPSRGIDGRSPWLLAVTPRLRSVSKVEPLRTAPLLDGLVPARAPPGTAGGCPRCIVAVPSAAADGLDPRLPAASVVPARFWRSASNADALGRAFADGADPARSAARACG